MKESNRSGNQLARLLASSLQISPVLAQVPLHACSVLIIYSKNYTAMDLISIIEHQTSN
jgi:hypothetical protein